MKATRNLALFIGLLLCTSCGGEVAEDAADAGNTIPAAAPNPAVTPPATADSAMAQDTTGSRPSAVVPRAEARAAVDTSEAGRAALARASRAYESLRALRADFTMTLENPVLRRTTTSRGMLAQRTPDRILLRFTEPDGDMIVGDGTHFWIYYPSINPDQVTRAPAAQAESGGVDLRAQFIGDPAERFDWTLIGTDTVDGRAADVLSLVPKEPAGYRSLRVWVDDADGLVRRFRIEEHNGSMREFVLTSLERNPALADSLFTFEPPEGVRIVEPPGTN